MSISNEGNDIPVAELNVKGAKASAQDTKEEANTPGWFVSKSEKHNFSFELNGKKFCGRELPRETVKGITRRVREIARQSNDVQAENRRIELSLAKAYKQREVLFDNDEPFEGGDTARFVEIERVDEEITGLRACQTEIADEMEPVLEEQSEIYGRVIRESLTAWGLDAPLGEESFAALSMTASRAIGDAIIEASITGGDAANFRKRSRR